MKPWKRHLCFHKPAPYGHSLGLAIPPKEEKPREASPITLTSLVVEGPGESLQSQQTFQEGEGQLTRSLVFGNQRATCQIKA